jgi:hypothetical protein
MRRWAKTGLYLAAAAFWAEASTIHAQSLRDGLILLYEFEEGSGDMVTDTSGFGSPLNLMIQDPANTAWGSGLLSVTAPTIITSSIAPQKVFDAVIPANELSFEAWVRPENATLNGAARIFNIATDVAADAPTNRNFMFGQDNANIDARLRTTTTSNNGIPELVSDPGGPVVTEPTELLHLLYTRDASGVARTYVNGIEHALLTTVTGDLSNWDLSYRVSLAHEFADSAADSRRYRVMVPSSW